MPEPSTVALETRGLSRAFGAIHAVQNLNLCVEPGDVYGFLGPNGAGKTTAMRCILGLIRKDAGEVRIFGDTNLTRARRQVGAIIETPAFHGWMSGRENLEQAAAYAGIPHKQVKSELDRVLARVGLTERAKDSAGKYSLGMKQRLGIARALLGSPRLLMLDEPTNGLDPAGMKEMRTLIRSLALHDQITIFISSHLLAEVQAICNRVGIIQAGTLRREGDVADLLSTDTTEQYVEIAVSDRTRASEVLGAIEGVTVLGAGEAGRLRVRHDAIPIARLNKALVSANLDVDALVPQKRDLEDVFMEVTR